MTPQRTKLLSVIICLLVVTLGTATAQAGLLQPTENALGPTSPTMSIAATKLDQQATLNMWSRDARAAAKPLPFSTEAYDESGDTKVLSTGEPGFSSSGGPNPQSDAMAQREFPAEWQALQGAIDIEGTDAPEGTAAIYAGYYGNYYTHFYKFYPYKAVGKLYFKTSSGSASCSASVVSGNNIIVTAAHCVYDYVNNRWYSNWVFVPADRAGVAPYGTFPWTNARVLTAWDTSGGARRYDVALLKLGNNGSGRSVTYYTGWLGRSWNYSYAQLHHAVGYPSNLSSGQYSYFCVAESFNGGTDVLGMGCNMTYGSSGGPWIRWFTPYVSGACNYVNSVVSGGTPGTNTFYGPRFSSNNIVPLCTASGC